MVNYYCPVRTVQLPVTQPYKIYTLQPQINLFVTFWPKIY